MDFNQSYQEFNNVVPCVNAFATLQSRMEHLISINELGTSAYYLIAGFCSGFVLCYNEEAVPNEILVDAKETMCSYLLVLKQAFETKQKDKILDAMDLISKKYSQSHFIFN